jgi:hypothetical protein
MQTGKSRIIPVVLLEAPGGTYWDAWLDFLRGHLMRFGFLSEDDMTFFNRCDTPEQAVAEIVHFYSNYQSSRWVGERLVIRLARALGAEALMQLNGEFADLLRVGRIEQTGALPQEANEPEIWNLPRLVLVPYRRDFARFRQLIDALNESADASDSSVVGGRIRVSR